MESSPSAAEAPAPEAPVYPDTSADSAASNEMSGREAAVDPESMNLPAVLLPGEELQGEDELREAVTFFYTATVEADGETMDAYILDDPYKEDFAQRSRELYDQLSAAQRYEFVYAQRMATLGFDGSYLIVGHFFFTDGGEPLAIGDLWLRSDKGWRVIPFEFIADETTLVTTSAGATFNEVFSREDMDKLSKDIQDWSKSVAESTKELGERAAEGAKNFGDNLKRQIEKLTGDKGTSPEEASEPAEEDSGSGTY